MANLSDNLSGDSALIMLNKRLEIAAKAGFRRVGATYTRMAEIYKQKGKLDSALFFLHASRFISF